MSPPNDNLDIVEDTALGGEGSEDNEISETEVLDEELEDNIDGD